MLAYLIYNDGIQTVIGVAAVFAQRRSREAVGHSNRATDVAHLDDSVCGVRRRTVLRLAGRRVGAKRALMVSLLIWAGTVIYAFIGLRNPTLTSFGIPQAELEFWILGVFIAAVLGGSQALSRSCSRR